MKFTLSDIRAAAQAKYGSTDITLEDGTEVKLENPLRLSKPARTSLGALQDRMNAEGADMEALLHEAIHLVADSKPGATKLLKEVGDDLTVLVEIFRNYSEGTQVGEASASES